MEAGVVSSQRNPNLLTPPNTITLTRIPIDEKLQRYVAALRRTARNPHGLLTIPDELAPEFYEDSIDAALDGHASVLDFLKHSLTLTDSSCEVGERATTGLYFILHGAIDNAENCATMLHAYRIGGGGRVRLTETTRRRDGR